MQWVRRCCPSASRTGPGPSLDGSAGLPGFGAGLLASVRPSACTEMVSPSPWYLASSWETRGLVIALECLELLLAVGDFEAQVLQLQGLDLVAVWAATKDA